MVVLSISQCNVCVVYKFVLSTLTMTSIKINSTLKHLCKNPPLFYENNPSWAIDGFICKCCFCVAGRTTDKTIKVFEPDILQIILFKYFLGLLQ